MIISPMLISQMLRNPSRTTLPPSYYAMVDNLHDDVLRASHLDNLVLKLQQVVSPFAQQLARNQFAYFFFRTNAEECLLVLDAIVKLVIELDRREGSRSWLSLRTPAVDEILRAYALLPVTYFKLTEHQVRFQNLMKAALVTRNLNFSSTDPANFPATMSQAFTKARFSMHRPSTPRQPQPGVVAQAVQTTVTRPAVPQPQPAVAQVVEPIVTRPVVPLRRKTGKVVQTIIAKPVKSVYGVPEAQVEAYWDKHLASVLVSEFERNQLKRTMAERRASDATRSWVPCDPSRVVVQEGRKRRRSSRTDTCVALAVGKRRSIRTLHVDYDSSDETDRLLYTNECCRRKWNKAHPTSRSAEAAAQVGSNEVSSPINTVVGDDEEGEEDGCSLCEESPHVYTGRDSADTKKFCDEEERRAREKKKRAEERIKSADAYQEYKAFLRRQRKSGVQEPLTFIRAS